MESKRFPLNADQVRIFLAFFRAWSCCSLLESDAIELTSSCFITLDLLLCLNSAHFAFFIDVVKSWPYLMEFLNWSQHELLVLEHANSVIGLNSYFD